VGKPAERIKDEPSRQKVAARDTKTTTIDIDQAKFAEVRQVLGTRTLRETVDRSFDEVLARAARERSIRRLQKMEGLDLDKPKVMEGAWR
jgi:Arc/MetJ family transcription regulator